MNLKLIFEQVNSTKVEQIKPERMYGPYMPTAVVIRVKLLGCVDDGAYDKTSQLIK